MRVTEAELADLVAELGLDGDEAGDLVKGLSGGPSVEHSTPASEPSQKELSTELEVVETKEEPSKEVEAVEAKEEPSTEPEVKEVDKSQHEDATEVSS